ncbi:uncharacterized protein LOC141613152 [Silene latifolia]|uniref:uncharacterized protein LOC141613152 n=1 Tax=Silene latifolia TaxID=37657 RepID=UPI003D7753EE
MTNPENTTIVDSSKSQNYSFVHVENPNNNITPIIFNGQNYDEWFRAFLLALLAKGKSEYLDGTVTKPAVTAANYSAWRSTNALVTAWILNSLDSSIRRTISLRPEAKQVWTDIKNRFCQNNDASIYRLQADLLACRQGTTESLMAYYGRMTAIWDDILDTDPLPSCSCNPCSCDWVQIMAARRDKKRVRDFLMGLDDRFDNARSNILGTNPLPALEFVYNRLLQEEGVRSLHPMKTETRLETMAFATRVTHGHKNSGGGEGGTP